MACDVGRVAAFLVLTLVRTARIDDQQTNMESRNTSRFACDASAPLLASKLLGISRDYTDMWTRAFCAIHSLSDRQLATSWRSPFSAHIALVTARLLATRLLNLAPFDA